jgi:hypothetical protein
MTSKWPDMLSKLPYRDIAVGGHGTGLPIGRNWDDVKGALQRKSDAPLKPSKPQEPCDSGLFSDDASQIDWLNRR